MRKASDHISGYTHIAAPEVTSAVYRLPNITCSRFIYFFLSTCDTGCTTQSHLTTSRRINTSLFSVASVSLNENGFGVQFNVVVLDPYIVKK